ncbi:WhiB family transcriptional regulator [Streptomyces lasiicapitis]|uniref:WhiB family transcriptional regulator n=1 Tax=Streptomyces lasiicapitis TaxID=1923961 RepID=UPI00331A3E59
MTIGVLTRPASAAEDGHWVERGACGTATAADFCGNDAGARDRARHTCRACPVLAQCLAERTAIDPGESWGIIGGLDVAQRRALEIAELIGERPDLARAQELLDPRWRYRLHNLRVAHVAPQRIAELLTREGIAVDTITVRVALWWTGGSGTVLGRRARRDKRPAWQRLRDDHAEVIQRLRANGARSADVAAYFDVSISASTRAVRAIAAAAAVQIRTEMSV